MDSTRLRPQPAPVLGDLLRCCGARDTWPFRDRLKRGRSGVRVPFVIPWWDAFLCDEWRLELIIRISLQKGELFPYFKYIEYV